MKQPPRDLTMRWENAVDGSIMMSRLQQQEVLTLGGGREKSTPMKNCRDK